MSQNMSQETTQMTSFQLQIKPSRRAAARFVGKVRRALQAAVVEDRVRTGMTQSKIAEAIGAHRSVISRELNGRQDITLGRVAELAWALGREIDFELRVPEAEVGQNVPIAGAAIIEQFPIRASSVSTALSAERDSDFMRSASLDAVDMTARFGVGQK